MNTITKILRSEITTGPAYGFSAPVAGRDWRGCYTDENRAAHGNIVVRETHRPTGYWRSVAINQNFREEGPWMRTIDHSREIAGLRKQLVSIEAQISKDLQRAEKELKLSGVKWNPERCRKWADYGTAGYRTGGPYAYLSATAESMEEHDRIETKIDDLTRKQGDFAVAAQTID